MAMGSQGQAGGNSNPRVIVKDALEQYPDLPDEDIVGMGPEDYILQRLNEAGWRLVRRTEWNGATGTDAAEWTPDAGDDTYLRIPPRRHPDGGIWPATGGTR